jgi:hypothetical protein
MNARPRFTLSVNNVHHTLKMQRRQLMVDIPSNDSLAPLLLGLSGGLLVLSILLLSARLWSRRRNLKADDWAVLAGIVRPRQINHIHHI